MSVPSIAESLFATRDDMTDEEKTKQAQKIYDSMMKGFPDLAKAIAGAQAKAARVGYTETVLGRRRHHPNMQLPKFEFEPMKGYVNPDIDPLDPESLQNKEQIPKRIVEALTKEFNSYKWYGKIVKRTKELAEEKIKVINNNYKIEEASRQVFNCVDKETEILTKAGWKKYNEVQVGDEILSYSIENRRIEDDVVTAVHIYDEPAEVIEFNSPTFTSVSTLDHRWVVQDNSGSISFKTTREIINTELNSDIYLITLQTEEVVTDSSTSLESISSLSINETTTNGVWCVSTNNMSWIARRHGKVYVTGNSIVQGSAADLTKMAMLRLEHDDEWKAIGGRFLVPVHDELICEVPSENAEKGAEVLARCMCEAGDFLPFKLTCDVETTFRWYGLPVEEILSRDVPDDLNWDTLSTSNIEWLQCMIVENEYLLPTFPEADGSKPDGIRAQGVNGIVTDELKAAIEDYKSRYNIEDDKTFIDHIGTKVVTGRY